MSKNNEKQDKNSQNQTHLSKSKGQIRPGPFARRLLVRGENTRKFEEFRQKVEEELKPEGDIEQLLCEKFISSAWKHRRALEIERNILSEQNIPDEQDEYDPFDPMSGTVPSVKRRARNIKKVRVNTLELQKLMQHQIALEKNMMKALEQLRVEQELRKSDEK